MDLIELLIIAVGVSMDAFAVSICKGLSVCRLRPSHVLSTGLWFGGFHHRGHHTGAPHLIGNGGTLCQRESLHRGGGRGVRTTTAAALSRQRQGGRCRQKNKCFQHNEKH